MGRGSSGGISKQLAHAAKASPNGYSRPKASPRSKTRTPPSSLARLLASQEWPDVQAQYQLGRGVYGFTCAGHGGIIAVIGEAELDPKHVEVARKQGKTELVAEVRSGSRTKRYTSHKYTRSSLEELAKRSPEQVSLVELWAGEEDCDWATIVHANPDLLDAGKNAGYFGSTATMETVADNVRAWNERFLQDLDPNYKPIPGGQIEKEDRHRALLSSGAHLRSSAISEDDGRVRVTFRNKDGNERSYYMSSETYRAIGLSEDATPDDYRKYGVVSDE